MTTPSAPSSTLARLVPGADMLRTYDRSWLRPDLLAGVTVWAMLVPQGLGYATLAGMPAVAGLYAAFGALLLYWLWGSSKELNVGPESTVAIMVATVLTPLAAAGSDEYVALAATLAILVGLILLIGGLFRLGRIADLFSRPILAGYVFGSGLLIIGSQLPDLFGLEVDTSLYATNLGAVLRNLDQTNATALAIGAGTIALMLILRRLAPKVPGALVAIVISILLVSIGDLSVEVVGSFPSGLPLPALPSIGIDNVLALIGPAFAIAFLVYPDSVLTGRSLAVRGKYRLDADAEFFGVGAANIASGLFQGFPVNGSQSRSFVVADAGAKSQVSNLWAALLVLLTLLFLSPLFENLPTAALAGIVIVAGLGLLDPSDFIALWRYRRTEFVMAVFTAGAVMILGMLIGILIAVGLSLLLIVVRAASPQTAVLGRLPETDTYRDTADHPEAETFNGLLIYRFDAPLFFANAGQLRDDLLNALSTSDPPIAVIVLDLESVYDIDATSAQILNELCDALDEAGVELWLARVRTEIRDELEVSGLEERIGPDRIFLEVDDAVRAHLSES